MATPKTDKYAGVFGPAIKAVVADMRQMKKEMGFDLRFVIHRNPRKKTVTLEQADDNTEIINPHDFDRHLINLANDLGLQGKRVTKVVPGVEGKWTDAWKAVIHWEWAKPKKKRQRAK